VGNKIENCTLLSRAVTYCSGHTYASITDYGNKDILYISLLQIYGGKENVKIQNKLSQYSSDQHDSVKRVISIYITLLPWPPTALKR
jgi:hypothetical protein